MTTTVTSRFLKTFLILSGLFFLFLSILRAFVLSDFSNFGMYKIVAVLFSILLTYTYFFPYALSFSLYRAFFYYDNDDGDSNLLKVTQKTIIIALLLMIGYTSMIVFFSSSISKNIHNIYASQEYMHLYKSRQNKSLEYLELAREAFAVKDYDKAIEVIGEGLSFLPDDEDLIIYLKYVTSRKDKDFSANKSDSDAEREKTYMEQAVDAYSTLDYDTAKKLFLDVLDINDENGMAKFYLNKIALHLGEENSLFTRQSEDELVLYRRVADGIAFYTGEQYWEAYNIFRDIYVAHPFHFEVFDYYNLAMAKIKINDFFITDAEFLYEIFVDKSYSASTTTVAVDREQHKSSIFELIKFPISYDSVCDIEFFRLSENKYLYTTVLNIFNETYFFDTLIITTSDDGVESYQKYRFGKLVPSIKEGVYNIVLKGQYYSDKTYNENDLENYVLTVATPANLFSVAKHIDVTDFVSIVDMITLLEYMPNFGFDRKAILNILMYKIFLPLELLLIAVVISYYSMRYRIKGHVHFFHKVVGLFGSIFLTFMVSELFALIIHMISIVSGKSYIGFIALAIITLIPIAVYSIQFFRVKIDESE